jgi:hypothetical protein
MDTPSIRVADHAGNPTADETLTEFVAYTIQDDEIGLRIARELLQTGHYEFAGDGEDPTTDQIFTVIDASALAAQIDELERELDA